MQVISLGIRYRKTVRPIRTIPPGPYAAPSIAPSRGSWPLRGLVYSFLFHELTFFGLLFLSSYTFAKASKPDEHVEIIQLNRNRVLLLPGLSAEPAGAKSAVGSAEGRKEAAPEGGKEATRGLSYPGLQNVVSDPARATNHFQTLLQPGLVNPPTLRPPLMLPNIIQMTNAGPQLAGPTPPPTKEPAKVAALDQPARIAEPRIASINIPNPAPVAGMRATPPPNALPAEMRQIEQPDLLAPRLAGITPLRAAAIPEIRATPPPMTAVDGPAAMAAAPKPPARLAAGQVLPAATTQGQAPTAPPKALPNAVSSVDGPAAIVPAPKLPARLAAGQALPAATTQGQTPTAPPKALPNAVSSVDGPAAIAATPKLPARLAAGQVLPAATTQSQAPTAPPKALPKAVSSVDGPAAIAPAPSLPARLAAGPVLPAATTQGQAPAAPPKALPNAVSSVLPPSEVATSTKRAPALTTGTDPRNLLSVSPLPPPPEPQVRLPAGEARGRVALSTNPNLAGAANTLGVKTDNPPSSKPVLTAENKSPAALNGGKDDGAPEKSPLGKDDPPKKDDPKNDKTGSGASPNGAAPSTGQLSGRGATTTSSTATGNPFGGITIQGGRLEPADPRIGTTSPGIITLGQPGPPAPASGGYTLSIVATAGSGGGLPDLGVFSNEQVYTVYLDVKPTPETAGRSWTLQYAVVDAKRPASAPATTQERGITPPFPIAKEYPQFPAELLRKHPQRLMVLYAIIDTNGKLQQMAVKQTPDPELNTSLLTALSKWTFRPVELDGRPVAAKILLGIPLAP